MEGGKSFMSVDQRVVQMTFDNKQFESGVKTSMSSLDRLKKALNFDGATKSLANLENAGKNFSLAGMESGVAALSNRFSTMGVVGFTVIQNLTNSAINAGKRITKAITGPLIDGGIKRALNIEKAKFQFKGLGMDVEATMASALAAVKGTAFGLDEAAVAASMFGATGMRAGEEMTAALRGISGVAAMTGSSYSDISQVFTTVAGNGRLMGTELLRLSSRGINAAATLAKEFGTTEEAIRSMVSKGQISFEMFAKAMDNAFGEHATKANETYTGSLANLRSAFGRIGATVATSVFENQRKVINALTPVIDKLHEALKPLLTSMTNFMEMSSRLSVSALEKVDLSGFDAAIPFIVQSITNVMQGLANALIVVADILQPIEQAFIAIFPPMTGKRIVELTAGFKAFMESLQIGKHTMENIERTFRGLFAAIDLAKQVIFAIGKVLLGVVKAIFPFADSLLYVTAIIGDFVYGLAMALKSSEALSEGVSKIGRILGTIIKSISDVLLILVRALDAMVRMDTSGIEAFADRIQVRFSPVAGLLNIVSGAITRMVDVIKKASPIFAMLGDIIGNAFGKLGTIISNAFKTGDFNALFDIINSGLFAYMLVSINDLINRMAAFTTNLGGFGLRVKQVLFGVEQSLIQYQSNLKANVLLKIAFAIGVLAAALTLLSLLDSVKLTFALGAMTTMFVQLFGALTVFQKLMPGISFLSLTKLTLGLIALSTSMLILSFAVAKLSKLDWGGLVKGLVGLTGLIAIIGVSSKLLDESSGKLIRGSVGLILFSTSILILTSAVKRLGELDISSLAKGLIGVGILVAQIALFMKFTDLKGMGLFKGLGLIAFATSLVIFANAVKKFGELDDAALIKGLMSMGIVLTQIAIFTKMTGDSKRVISTAIGLTILGSAILIFASAVSKMGELSWSEIGRGLTTMAGALAIVAGAMHIMPKGLILQGTGLVLIATSLLILSNALSNMKAMSWVEIGKGLVVLASSLAIIAGAMYLMVAALPGAAALLIVAGSLAILTPILLVLGKMSWSEIGKGLVALAGAFLLIGGASALLTPLIPSMLGLAAAIAILGVGLLAIGVGILAFSAGMTALAVAGTAGTVALVAMVSGIIGLIPMAIKALATGLVDFIKIIGESIPVITKALTDIVVALLDVLETIIPKVVDTVYVLLSKMLEKVVVFSPKLIKAGIDMVLGFLKGIRDNIGGVVKAGYDIVINFLDAIGEKIPELMDAGVNLVLSFINGLANTIEKNVDPLIDAMENLVDVIIESALKMFSAYTSKWKEVGSNMMSGITAGVKHTAGAPVRAVKNVTGNLMNSVTSMLGIKSPSRFFRWVGNMGNVGWKEGIEASSDKPVDAIKKVVGEVASEAGSVATKSGAAAKSAFQVSLDWIEERKYYNLLSLKEELEAWEKIQARYATGSEERKRADREIYRLKNALIKEEFDNSRKWIDDRKYYQELSLQQELEAWERVHARYLEGSEERKEADRQLFRLKNDLMKTTYQNSIKWIENEKFYERETLNSRLAGFLRIKSELEKTLTTDVAKTASSDWEKNERDIFTSTKALTKANADYNESITNLYEQTNARRIEMEKEYYETTKGINDKLINDVKNLNNEYENAVKSRADALYSTYGMFDKVEPKDAVDGIDLVNNLKTQVIQFDDWRRSIQELAAKGVDEGLIRELEKMGPKSIEEIRALNRLNKPMLDQYVSLWQTKHEEARKQSVRELEYLKIETERKVSELNASAAKELDAYRNAWSTRLNALVEETIKQAKKLETDWLAIIGETTSSTERDFALMVRKLQRHLTKPDWSGLGKNIMDGISAGIYSGAKSLEDALVSVSKGGYEATENALGIASPSKEFMKIGKYSIEGVVLGLTKFAGQVYKAGTHVGNVAKDALRNAMSNIADVVNSDVDMTPTIRPVLDLSDIHAGNREMSSIFGDRTITADGRSLELTRSIGNPRAEQDSVLNVLTKLMSTLGRTDTEPKEITNEFNIENLQVREEADVRNIARQLYQLQVAGIRG
jgi:tape measure domain-containing protein